MKELTIKKLRDFIDNINGDAKVCVRYPDGRERLLVEKIDGPYRSMDSNDPGQISMIIKPNYEESQHVGMLDMEWFTASWHYQIAERLRLHHRFGVVVNEEDRLCICRKTPVGNIYVSNYIVDKPDCVANYVFADDENYTELEVQKAAREHIHIYNDDFFSDDMLKGQGIMYDNLYENIISLAYSADSVMME